MKRANRILAAFLALVSFAKVVQAESFDVRESLEIAWESLWQQTGYPVSVTRWQGPIRVKFTGAGVRWHRTVALSKLQQVAEVAGIEIAEVSDGQTANLEVEFVTAMAFSGRWACTTSFNLAADGAIDSVKIRADTDSVRGCMLHEAMHAMGIHGHPRGKTVLNYFGNNTDELTDADRFLLKSYYSDAIKPGALPFAALSAFARRLTDGVADVNARAEAESVAQSFLKETVAQMEEFANGKGEPPRIVFQSSTATPQGIRRGRIEMMHLLGRAYQDGTIVREDQKRAINYLAMAAESGHAQAESFLFKAHLNSAAFVASENPVVLFVRGRHYGNEGDYARAIAEFNDAIRLKPNDTRILWYRGSAYSRKRDYDRAIADFSEIIRLKGDEVNAWRSRGYAYRLKGEYSLAKSDLDQALRLRPNDAGTLRMRGMMFSDQDNHKKAMEDLNEAIRLKPDFGMAVFSRGYINYLKGEFRLAALDFERSAELEQKWAYPALWRYLAARRAGDDGLPALQRQTNNLKDKNWPAAVVSFYLGEIDPEAVYFAAGNSDPMKEAERVCEAHFYVGQYLLLKGDRDGSIERLATAAGTCPRDFFEYGMARVELRRLGVDPDQSKQASKDALPN